MAPKAAPQNLAKKLLDEKRKKSKPVKPTIDMKGPNTTRSPLATAKACSAISDSRLLKGNTPKRMNRKLNAKTKAPIRISIGIFDLCSRIIINSQHHSEALNSGKHLMANMFNQIC